MRICAVPILCLAAIAATFSPRQLVGQELPSEGAKVPGANQLWASLGAGPYARKGVIWHLAGWAARGPVAAAARFSGVAVGHSNTTDRMALSALIGARPPLQRSTLVLAAGAAIVIGTDRGAGCPLSCDIHSSYRVYGRPVGAGAVEWTKDFSMIGLGLSFTAVTGKAAFYGLGLLLKFGATHAPGGN